MNKKIKIYDSYTFRSYFNRHHFFEILDSPKIPAIIRSSIYNSLSLVQRFGGINEILTHSLLPILQNLGATQVVELGSGSGEHLTKLASEAKRLESPINFFLTDKFPNTALWQTLIKNQKNLYFRKDSFAFENLAALRSIRRNQKQLAILIINASHHMNEQTLKNFIAQAAKLKAHIIILEPLERKFSHLLLSILACSSGLTMPFLGKKKLTKRINEILIYYSGLGLLIQSFDGIISTLRQRTKKEWKQHIIDHPYRLEQRKKLGTFKNFSLTILEVNTI